MIAFLDAFSHVYKMVYPFVPRSVGNGFKKILKKKRYMVSFLKGQLLGYVVFVWSWMHSSLLGSGPEGDDVL